ncbi:MAG: serine/threonine-protein kinase, partial [Thermodesulfobacteriota bacterium]
HCGQLREFQNPPGALAPGTTLADRYMVGRCLGQGGFGITYLAWEEQLTRPVAIKEFFPREISYRDNDHTTVQPITQYKDKFSDILERFLLESRTVATFHQPNIVPIWFSFEANSTAYFVMPYHRGQTLEDWLFENQDRVTEADLVNIFVPLIHGLEAVHQAGILHRDIKPRNIYISEDGTPLLLDFGSARNVMSESFSVMMTHGYAPLEQYFSQQSSKEGRQGPWTDIYAVAATLYACFKCEFEGPHLVPIQRAPERVEGDQTQHIREVARIKVSSPVAEAIMMGLRVNPKERPQTAKEFRKMIEPELVATTLPPPPDQKLELRCIAGEHENLAVPLSATPIVLGWDPNAANLVCSESVISS